MITGYVVLVKIYVCVRVLKRKSENTQTKERERVLGRDRESRTTNFKIISTLCTFNALISAIYTSSHGADGSTMYFNAHTSI